MRELQIGDGDATLRSLVDDASRGEPSIITRSGRPEAVVVGFAEWKRLSSVPSFGRLLVASGLRDGDIAERDATPLRDLNL